MPRLNSRGDWCAGIGGGVVSVNGQVVLPYQSGGANWVDDNRVIGQVCDNDPDNILRRDKDDPRDRCRLELYNAASGVKSLALDHGANHIEAGGGVWAAWFGTHDPALVGITTSSGARFPTSGVGPVGPDGAIAIKVDYQSAGPWDVLERDGSRWRLTESDAGNINLLGNRRAVWSEPGGVIAATHMIAPLVLTRPFYWLTVREIDGAWWVLYQMPDSRLVLHPFDSPLGYVVTSGNTYRPDFVQVSNGSIRIVWALSEGEPPADVRTRDIELTETRVDLRAPLEEPVSSKRFWFAPNIASRDLVTLFDDPATLAPIEVFCLPVQDVIFDGANQGLNTWQALQANHVYQKLKQAGIPLSIEMGSVKGGDCQAIANIHNLEWAVGVVREHKGEVAYISMDEPLTADKDGCHQGIDKTADAVAAFMHTGRDLGVTVGWIEAWPHIDFLTQRTFLGLLKQRDALPAFWHLDIDWNRAANERKDPATFLASAQQTADDYDITLGIYLNTTIDPLMTDAAHYANVVMLADKVHGLVPKAPRLIVASWAFRTGGIQDLPNNLGGNGLLASYAYVTRLFAGAAPPVPEPIPEPIPVKELLHMIAYSTPIVGYSAGELEMHPDGDGSVVRKPNGKVLCLTPDGVVEERPNDGTPVETYTPGAWEKFTKGKNGTSLIAKRDGGRIYVLSLVE